MLRPCCFFLCFCLGCFANLLRVKTEPGSDSELALSFFPVLLIMCHCHQATILSYRVPTV
ncbi:hypothetical protein HD806DRAFT_474735, partial [Xylariaceae sp. AK1471]